MRRQYKPQPILYVVVDDEEGTHHGTFDDPQIASDEAYDYGASVGVSASVYRYRRGRVVVRHDGAKENAPVGPQTATARSGENDSPGPKELK